MLRSVLVERLGLRYRLVDRETPVYVLIVGGDGPKLIPSSGPEPNPGAMRMGTFKNKSATLRAFTGFLSSLMDRPVLDRTGLGGKYQFDVDWSAEIADSMREYGPHGDPRIAVSGVRKLGLQLNARKESLKVLVIDRVSQRPTPN
jgi:uncharacterized protein (TIGR03435 family)